jgi:hypothetical protein
MENNPIPGGGEWWQLMSVGGKNIKKGMRKRDKCERKGRTRKDVGKMEVRVK